MICRGIRHGYAAVYACGAATQVRCCRGNAADRAGKYRPLLMLLKTHSVICAAGRAFNILLAADGRCTCCETYSQFCLSISRIKKKINKNLYFFVRYQQKPFLVSEKEKTDMIFHIRWLFLISFKKFTFLDLLKLLRRAYISSGRFSGGSSRSSGCFMYRRNFLIDAA